MNDFHAILNHALDSSGRFERGCLFPTILAEWPKAILKREPGTTMADKGMLYFSLFGFKSDRTRMNQYGYPGLFRELSYPPPWVEVTPEDADGQISQARVAELRPLYLLANEAALGDLLNRFSEHLEDRRRFSIEPGIGLSPESGQMSLELFEEKLLLARCLGTEDYENLCEAVFDFDEFTTAAGAPDLFVWDPEAGMWFFVEVKGPRDHLRRSQADWVRAHWESIKGRFVLLVVPPKA